RLCRLYVKRPSLGRRTAREYLKVQNTRTLAKAPLNRCREKLWEFFRHLSAVPQRRPARDRSVLQILHAEVMSHSAIAISLEQAFRHGFDVNLVGTVIEARLTRMPIHHVEGRIRRQAFCAVHLNGAIDDI